MNSNWGMGQCGTRISSDPRVFGPYTWRTLHRFAEHYPVAPTPSVKEACVNWINALPLIIPCAHCGNDLYEVSTKRLLPCERLPERYSIGEAVW